MGEKKQYLRARPDKDFPWCTIPFSKESAWDGILSEMLLGDTFEFEVVEMTEKEYKELPEFMGW